MALITALLIMALAAVAVAAFATRQQAGVQRLQNGLLRDQAWELALGVEAWAAGQLWADLRTPASSLTDHAQEAWAAPLPPTPVEGGEISGQMLDLQGRFNLNNLILGGRASALDLARFRRLLQALRLDAAVADAVLDWLDADAEVTLPAGAEDGHYLRQAPPYRAANGPLTEVSELRLIAGMTQHIYDTLAVHVCALPGRVDINVNTATAPLLMALAPGLSETGAQSLIAARAAQSFTTLPAFLQHESLAGLGVDSAGLAVRSQHFLAFAEVRLGNARHHLYSVLQRQPAGHARTLLRGQVP